MRLVIHPSDAPRVATLKTSRPQSLLISGKKGIGLSTIAREIANNHVAAVLQPRNKKDEIDEENGTITIEMIRRLYEQTRSKHTTDQVIIIDDGDRMSRGAQAAFLKLLEEPNPSTYFIITSHTPQNLALTIRSRVQHLQLQPITAEQTNEFIVGGGATEDTKRRQLEFIATGLPAELTRLLTNDTYFNQRAEIISDARDLLTATPYKKLLIINKYQTNRSKSLQLIDSSLMIARRSMSARPQTELAAQLSQLLSVHERVSGNHSVRLQLARVVL